MFGITGTGAPPHLSLGFVIAKYSKGVWHRRVGEEEEKTSDNRQRKREAEEAHKVEVASRVIIASLRCFRAALIRRTQELPKRRRV